MKTNKKIIAVINWEKQNKEQNISWADYPIKNYKTGRNLKNTLGYYYASWEEYIQNIEPKQYTYKI